MKEKKVGAFLNRNNFFTTFDVLFQNLPGGEDYGRAF